MSQYKILESGFTDKVKHIRDNSILADNKVTYESEYGLIVADFNNGTFTAPDNTNLGVVNIFYHNAITLYISSITKKMRTLDVRIKAIDRYLALYKINEEEKLRATVKCKCSMESRIKGSYWFIKEKVYEAESTFDKGITLIDEQEARHYITEGFFDMYFEGDFSDIYRTLT
jgi:predicted small secreted protein